MKGERWGHIIRRRAVARQLIDKSSIFGVFNSTQRILATLLRISGDCRVFSFPFPTSRTNNCRNYRLALAVLTPELISPTLWPNSHCDQIIFPEFCHNFTFQILQPLPFQSSTVVSKISKGKKNKTIMATCELAIWHVLMFCLLLFQRYRQWPVWTTHSWVATLTLIDDRYFEKYL